MLAGSNKCFTENFDTSLINMQGNVFKKIDAPYPISKFVQC